jgi:hypothetical protein
MRYHGVLFIQGRYEICVYPSRNVLILSIFVSILKKKIAGIYIHIPGIVMKLWVCYVFWMDIASHQAHAPTLMAQF